MTSETAVDVFLGVGSNIEPERNLPAALDLLREYATVTASSTMYRTVPLGRPEQPPFVNGAWRIRTSLSARELKFDVLRDIEARLGRVRTGDAYASRPIDLDIAVYGDAAIREPGLIVPDPDILTRPFLAIPLLELAPHLRLPGSRKPLADLPVGRNPRGLTPMPALTALLKERIAQ